MVVRGSVTQARGRIVERFTCERGSSIGRVFHDPGSPLSRQSGINWDDEMSHADSPLMQSLAAYIRPQIGLPRNKPDSPIDTTLANYAITRHRVGPLLHVAAKPNRSLDERVATLLSTCYKKNVYNTLAKKAVVQRLDTLFREHDIDFSLLKGTGLADQIYEDPSLRVTNDIDILVPVHATESAVHILSENGYFHRPQSINKKARATRKRQLIEINIFKDVIFLDPQFSEPVELHQRLFATEPKNFTNDFNSAVRFRRVPTVTDTRYCLYLIMHGAISLWMRLKWMIDLSLLVRQIPMKGLEGLMDEAKNCGCEQAVCASLWFAEEIFPGTLDKGWRSILDDRSDTEEVAELLALFRNSLLTTSQTQPNSTAAVHSKFFDVHAKMFGKKVSVLDVIVTRLGSSIAVRI